MINEYMKPKTDSLLHMGVQYLDFLRVLNDTLRPASYFEIGTNEGFSLAAFTCDAVCVDPEFIIRESPLGRRRTSLFFQMTSDEFFRSHNLRTFLPLGPDICFLDGMHRFEYLLRDFINTEAACRPNSIVLLHDCLPLNERMAERTMRLDETEDNSTRHAWTGDVWRILPTLKKHRPDLRIMLLDCGPTGLVAVTGLNPESRVLANDYQAVVDEAMNLSLRTSGVQELRHLYPMIDTARLAEKREDMTAIFNIS